MSEQVIERVSLVTPKDPLTTIKMYPIASSSVFCEEALKSKLIAPMKLRVNQVMFAGGLMFILQPHFIAKLRSGGG